MIALSPSQFSLAAPLFTATRYGVLSAGTLQGGHPGQVFVDQLEQPRSALLCTRVGYYFLAGQPDVQPFSTWLPRVFTQELVPQQAAMIGDPQVLLFYPSADWHAPLLKTFTMEAPLALHKKRMVLAPDALIACDSPLADGLHVQAYDQALLEQHPELGGEAALFYGSIPAFLAGSLGFAVLDERGKIASSCHAVFTGAGEAEISISTAPEYRRQGLARRAALEFISACRRRGQEPIWGCFPENTASVALARSLGFVDDVDQAFYLFQHLNGGSPNDIPSTNTATA